jgi:hypothetical protein
VSREANPRSNTNPGLKATPRSEATQLEVTDQFETFQGQEDASPRLVLFRSVLTDQSPLKRAGNCLSTTGRVGRLATSQSVI